MAQDEQMPDLTKESAPQPETAESLAGLFHANRLRKNLSFEELASTTKYSKWQLQAMEDNKWDSLPQGFALRALVRKYAVALDIDPDVALSMLAHETGNRSPSDGSRNLVSSLDYKMSPIAANKRGKSGFSFSTLIWLIIILVLVVLGVALWQGTLTLDDLKLGFVKDWFDAV